MGILFSWLSRPPASRELMARVKAECSFPAGRKKSQTRDHRMYMPDPEAKFVLKLILFLRNVVRLLLLRLRVAVPVLPEGG